MDAQLLIIIALFAAALFYLGRRLWLAFAAKEAGCAKGCGGACGAALDVEALQRTIEARTAGR